MIEPLSKALLARAVYEAAGAAGVSMVALTITPPEVGIGVTVLMVLLGMATWGSRLQTTVEAHTVTLVRFEVQVADAAKATVHTLARIEALATKIAADTDALGGQ